MPIPAIVGIWIGIVSIRISIIRIWSGIGVNRPRRYWTDGQRHIQKENPAKSRSQLFFSLAISFLFNGKSLYLPFIPLLPFFPPILKSLILQPKSLISFSQVIKRMGLKSVDSDLNCEGGLVFNKFSRFWPHPRESRWVLSLIKRIGWPDPILKEQS